ncbi:hypothetical protein CEP54_013664 [Fusarium duplospermum]|uniref:Protein kinase domain-containing protein n=1 Tax=Fusarium duplospermum TaxID=1325734 RepID=A0A428P1H1_9HYPO|nr:hypothetical protein CEP54_013664 [Fusarium duplospermum]
MEELTSKITPLQRSYVRNKYFIPEAAFFQVMTDEQVQKAIAESEIKPYQRDEVVKQVCQSGKKILGTLILANQASLLQHFIEADQLEDAKLPFTEETLIQTVRLTKDQATKFDKEQWVFTAPTFRRGTINRRLVEGSVLPFKVDKKIGEGGFGDVYEVVLDPDHQTEGSFPKRVTYHLFLKSSLPATNCHKFVRKEIHKEKFHQQELQTLAVLNSLKHPNMIELLSSYTYDNAKHNLLFPLVEHGSLKRFMGKDRQSTQHISDDSIITALAGLSSAVKHLHDFTEKNLDLELIGCHHDLKPQNILVSDATFILADFGISKLKPSDQDSKTSFRSRTDDYVAPECEDWDNDYQRGSVHRSSDIWSFGCIISELVTYVFQGPKGIEDFREARKLKIPGATHYSFHNGPKKSSAAVSNWLSDLETSSPRNFALIIRLVRRMLCLNHLNRPKANQVEAFIRFVALYQTTTRINDQFQQFDSSDSDSPNLDTFLEHVRFTSWRYAVGVLDVQGEADVELRLNHNVLDQFDKIVDVFTRLQSGLDSRLSRDKTATHLDISQLPKLNDELELFLNERQTELSREHFKVTISDDERVAEVIQNDDGSIPLSREIRMRTNIKHMVRLLEQDLASPSRALQIEPDQVYSLDPFGQHHLGRCKDDNGSRQVWVEWRKYGNHGADEDTMTKLYDRASALAGLLSQDKPAALRTLHCSGFIHRPERQAFGIVFEFPQAKEAQTSLEVLQLSKVIERSQTRLPQPDLDDRFKLAHALASALSEFHSVGWLHKSLTAENVIFFDAPVTNASLSPWLVGFSHSKPDDPKGFTSGLSDAASKMYHHPIYLKNTHGYRREFDYYSLGIVLLEIGHWEPFDKMSKKWTGSYEERRQRLLKGRVPGLRKTMGRAYSEAVRFCIESATDEALSRMSPKDVLLQFVQRVVTPLSSFPC